MAVPAAPYVSPEEYLALERASIGRRCEYIDGHVYAMAGTSYVHVTMNSNLLVAVATSRKGSNCRSGANELRMRTPSTYPDLFVVCGEPRFQDDESDFLLNPILLLEILSPSTEGYDRGKKFDRYRELESLHEYVLVSQDRRAVEVFERTEPAWTFRAYGAEGMVMELGRIGVKLSLDEIYDGVPLDLTNDPNIPDSIASG